MAFPSPTTRTSNNTQAPYAPTLPATIDAGDLLISAIRWVADVGTVTWPAGWTVLDETTTGQDGANADMMSIAWKKADGTEDGSSPEISVSGATNLKWAGVTYRITGAADPTVQPPEISTIATGSSTTPNPTSVTPTGGAKDYLWIWLGGWEGEQTSPPAAAATNYSGLAGTSTGTGGAVAGNCQIATCSRQLNASSEDPGSITISASDQWSAWTIAVHPAGFTPALNAYRFYNDGTESGATAFANQDTTAADIVPGTVYGLRTRIQNTTAVAGASTDDYQLQCSRNGGAFQNVTGASTIVQAAAGSLTDGSATTNRLTAGSGSFVAGEQEEVNGVVEDLQITASNYTELVYSIAVQAADVAAGDSITFRVMLNGVAMTSNVTPTLTVAQISLDQTAYRIYDDDAAENASTAMAAQDTAFTDAKAGNAYQLRIRLQNGSAWPGLSTDDYQLQYSYDGGAFTDVTTSSARIQAVAAGLTNDGASTNRLGAGSGSFVAGEQSSDGLVDNLTITASNYTELVFGFRVRNVPPAKSVVFRVLRNGVAVSTTQDPSITVTGTRFYLRSGASASGLVSSSGSPYKDASTSAGSTTADYTRSASGSSRLQWADGATFISWISARISNGGGFTCSGPIYSEVWVSESVATVNAFAEVTVHEFPVGSAAGNPNTEFADATNTASEIGTTLAMREIDIVPTSEAIAQGNRLAFRVYADPNGGTFGSGDVTLRVNGAEDASGCSFIQIAETGLTFYAETTYDLHGYRFYEDGTESGSTAIAAEDTGIDRQAATITQIRLGLKSSGGTGFSTDDWQLQCRINAGAWQDVTDVSTIVRAAASANLTDGGATTQRLGGPGSGSFEAGEIEEVNGLVEDLGIGGGNFTELLYSITIVDADTNPTDDIDFRLKYRNFGNDLFPTLSVTPTINVTAGAQTYNESMSLSAAAGLSTTGLLLAIASNSLSSTADLTVSPNNVMSVANTLDGTAGISIDGASSIPVSASLDATAGLSQAVTLTRVGDVTLTSSAAITCDTPGSIYNPTVSFAATADLTVSGNLIISSSAAYAATADITMSGGLALSGSISLSGTAGLTTAGALVQNEAIALSGTPDVAVSGSLLAVAALALSATPDIAATGTGLLGASVSLGGTAGLSVAHTLTISAAVSLGATAAITTSGEVVQGSQTYNESISLGGQAAITTDSVLIAIGTVDLTAGAAVTHAGTIIMGASVAYAATPALDQAASLTRVGAVALDATPDVAQAATLTRVGAITLSAAPDLSVTGLLVMPASLTLPATAVIEVNGLLIMNASAALSAAAGFAADAPVGEDFVPDNDQVFFTVSARPVVFAGEARSVEWVGTQRTVTVEADERGVSFDPPDR